MFNSSVLDVAIGMVFVYLLLSLMCSAANEVIELALKNRAKDLEKGLRQLLQDSDGGGLVSKIYQHPLVSSLFDGIYKPLPAGRLSRLLAQVRLPSYIPARTFALVLLDTVCPAQSGSASGTKGTTATVPPMGQGSSTAFDTLRNSISNLKNEKVEAALRALVDAADGDAVKARENIEKWFDSAMDRVSGWYKRRTQIFLLLLGFALAIFVNADSVLIAQRLSADKSLRESVVAAAQDYAKAHAGGLQQPNASASTSPKPSASASPSSSPSPSPKPSLPPGDTSSTSPSPSPSASPSGHGAQTAGATSSPSATPCESAECKYNETLDQLKRLALPIGWDSNVEGKQFPGLHFWEGPFWTGWKDQFRQHILGWLLTALAISLGSPFWFDLLNKFIVVRSTVKPKEKSPEEKSKG